MIARCLFKTVKREIIIMRYIKQMNEGFEKLYDTSDKLDEALSKDTKKRKSLNKKIGKKLEEVLTKKSNKRLTEAPFIDNTWVDKPEYKNDIKPVALDLLSIEEAEELPRTVLMYYHNWWWLRSPGSYSLLAADVYYNGSIYSEGNDISLLNDAVRPVLTVSNLNSSTLQLYKEYPLFGTKWIYIGDDRFLYNGGVIKRRFDRDSNKYETSDIKQFLNQWLRELQKKDVNESSAKKKLVKESFWNHTKYFDVLSDMEDKYLSTNLWNNATDEQRKKAVEPIMRDFWKQYGKEIFDADGEQELLDDLEDNNFHTEARILLNIMQSTPFLKESFKRKSK